VDSLAYNLYGTDKLICPMMDAKRNQVYTGLYEFTGDGFHVVKEQTVISVEEIVSEINLLGREVIYLGDGIGVYKEILKSETKVMHYFAPVHLNRQRAGAVGALGIIYFKNNITESAGQHEPVYLRLSQAERERALKKKDN
jgi:tRNA threonylcarbamoyladenosine biosynthesis protein TsaB